MVRNRFVVLSWLPAVVAAFLAQSHLPRAAAAEAGFAATDFHATVLSIGDGDTIRVRRQGEVITIRLACIDAPEIAQSPYGQQSRQYLQRRLSQGQDLTIRPQARDRYGRTVAEVISDANLGLAMVAHGQAFAYRRYLTQCDARQYLDAESRASRQRDGVWQVPGGITRPWDFRHGHHVAAIAVGTKPSGHRYRCSEIGSYARAQVLLHQGHPYLDGNGDGQACESLRN